jgi:hypothetical protein
VDRVEKRYLLLKNSENTVVEKINISQRGDRHIYERVEFSKFKKDSKGMGHSPHKKLTLGMITKNGKKTPLLEDVYELFKGWEYDFNVSKIKK